MRNSGRRVTADEKIRMKDGQEKSRESVFGNERGGIEGNCVVGTTLS